MRQRDHARLILVCELAMVTYSTISRVLAEADKRQVEIYSPVEGLDYVDIEDARMLYGYIRDEADKILISMAKTTPDPEATIVPGSNAWIIRRILRRLFGNPTLCAKIRGPVRRSQGIPTHPMILFGDN